jgi:hypothetical protein
MKHLADRMILSIGIIVVFSVLSSSTGYAAQLDAPLPSATLKPAAVEAFTRYVRLTDLRNQDELRQGADLLWIDRSQEPERAQAYAALQHGEVKLQRLETLAKGKTIECPDGMIHHWVGTAFIPGARLQDVLAVLKDYDRHAVYYAPDVERSRIEARDGDYFRVFLRFRQYHMVTITLNTEHEVQYSLDSEKQAHSRSSAVRIAQVENAGKQEEREKNPGQDNGFLWRMETWWRMQERDGGVYLQSEVASLSRNIPPVLGWLIAPFVKNVPKESLTFTLQATRKAVDGRLTRASLK